MMKNKRLNKLFTILQKYSLHLHHFAKNLAAHPDRSPLHHSVNYAAAGDRPACFARIFRTKTSGMFLRSRRLPKGCHAGMHGIQTVLFMQYAG